MGASGEDKLRACRCRQLLMEGLIGRLSFGLGDPFGGGQFAEEGSDSAAQPVPFSLVGLLLRIARTRTTFQAWGCRSRAVVRPKSSDYLLHQNIAEVGRDKHDSTPPPKAKASNRTTTMGKGKGKGRGESKPDKPGRAHQSAPPISRTQFPPPHAAIPLTTYELLEAILLDLEL